MTAVLPWIAGTSTLITTGLVVHRWLRPKFPIRVNCWFCNYNTKVPFGNKKCWDCPQCDQYNGFSEDGGYNKPIPAQHEEFFNQTSSATHNSNKNTPVSFKNGFCDDCNHNQQLKMQAVANFIPSDEDNYDDEVDDFKQYLERVYRLCRRCEAVLRQTLGQQDSTLRPQLLNWRIRNKRNKGSTVSSSTYSPFIKKFHPPHYFLRFLRLLICLTLFVTTVNEVTYMHRDIISRWIKQFIPPSFLVYIQIHQLKDLNSLCHLYNFVTFIFSWCALVVSLIPIRMLGFVVADAIAFVTVTVVVAFHAPEWVLTMLKPWDPFGGNLSFEYCDVIRETTCVVALIAYLWSTLATRKQLPSFQRIHKHGSMLIRVNETSAWLHEKSFNDFSLKTRLSQSGNGSLQDDLVCSTSSCPPVQQPTEILHSSLGAMSLGTPQKQQKHFGVFTLQDYNSTPSRLHDFPFQSQELRHRRPVLTPARFQSSVVDRHYVCSGTMPTNPWGRSGYWKPQQSSAHISSWSNSRWHGGHVTDRSYAAGSGRTCTAYENGSLFSPLAPSHGNGGPYSYYSPSCPASRSGSMCGGDDGAASLFSEPAYRRSPSFMSHPQNLNRYQQQEGGNGFLQLPLPGLSPDVTCNGSVRQSLIGNGERGSEGTNSSRSSSSTTCPVDTTTLISPSDTSTVSVAGSSIALWQKILLVVSIATNIVIAVFVTCDCLGIRSAHM